MQFEVSRSSGGFTIVLDAIFRVSELDPSSKLVYVYLCRMNRLEIESEDLEQYLTDETGLSRKKVKDSLQKLQDLDIVERYGEEFDLVSPSDWKWSN